MKYEIIIARHGSPLYRITANTIKQLKKRSMDQVLQMKQDGEPIDDLECVWEKFPESECDDIIMTSFQWEWLC